MTSGDVKLPPTSTSGSTVLVGLLSLMSCMWLLLDLPLFDLKRQAAANTDAALFLVLFIGMPMVLWEVLWHKSYRNPSANLAVVCQTKNNWRVFTKWLGLVATYSALAFVYWLLPLYRQDFYKPFMEAASGLLSTVLLVAWPYLSWVDKRQEHPEQDVYFKIGQGLINFLLALLKVGTYGQVLTRLYKPSAPSALTAPSVSSATLNVPTWLAEFLRAWCVKLFFLPLMFGFICENLAGISGWSFKWNQLSWVQQVEHLTVCIFMIDLLWGCVGYLWSLKICDSHIRSTEPTLLGWSVALAFYAPFNQVLGPSFFAYETNMKWHHWLAGYPEWAYVWGGALLLLHVCFVWATVVFGLRFSNLTHRGIITSGPYRYFKHPAYVCKNLSWWMIAMPFMATSSTSEALRLSLILILANIGYYLRAKTEERHLLQTCPEYAVYTRALAARSWGIRWKVPRSS
jgi:protein-S-isoprenylcysteine O-methyltransferase Ste14